MFYCTIDVVHAKQPEEFAVHVYSVGIFVKVCDVLYIITECCYWVLLLHRLLLQSLDLWRLITDLLWCYKIVFNVVDIHGRILRF